MTLLSRSSSSTNLPFNSFPCTRLASKIVNSIKTRIQHVLLQFRQKGEQQSRRQASLIIFNSRNYFAVSHFCSRNDFNTNRQTWQKIYPKSWNHLNHPSSSKCTLKVTTWRCIKYFNTIYQLTLSCRYTQCQVAINTLASNFILHKQVFAINKQIIGRKWLWEEAQVREVISSNPSTRY